jgi:hypothetical protein
MLPLAAADPNTLKLATHILKPLLDWEKLLLKHAQLVLACQKLQNKAAHPAGPQPADTQDAQPDNSQAIALMRKTFFADVDEYERTYPLDIPPVPDANLQCGAGILPAPSLYTPSMPDPVSQIAEVSS